MVLDINNRYVYCFGHIHIRVVYGFGPKHKTIELSMVSDINIRVVYGFERLPRFSENMLLYIVHSSCLRILIIFELVI